MKLNKEKTNKGMITKIENAVNYASGFESRKTLLEAYTKMVEALYLLTDHIKKI